MEMTTLNEPIDHFTTVSATVCQLKFNFIFMFVSVKCQINSNEGIY